jgi:hypothetical protein
MGQKDGEKWTAAVDLQPALPKSDSLLALVFIAQAAIKTESSKPVQSTVTRP